MMAVRMPLTAFFVAILCTLSLGADPVVEPTATWSGSCNDKSPVTLAPRSGFIADSRTWKTVWTAWRPGKKVPPVDFTRSLILVGTVPGPNRVIMLPTVNRNGHLRFVVGGTKIGGPGFGYKLIKVAREEIRTINGQPLLEANIGRKGSHIAFLYENNSAILDITSEFGIDTATVTTRADRWPKALVVRLHLRGLESFTAEGSDAALNWSISSSGTNQQRLSLRREQNEISLDETHAYYTRVRIVGGNGAVPLTGGYFEIPVSPEFLENNPKSLRLRWIDFYRN